MRCGARQSMPSNSMDNCARVKCTRPDCACGQMNRPRSSRLANRHNPSPAHHSNLMRSPRLPRNTNTWPLNGSSSKWVANGRRRRRTSAAAATQRDRPGARTFGQYSLGRAGSQRAFSGFSVDLACVPGGAYGTRTRGTVAPADSITRWLSEASASGNVRAGLTLSQPSSKARKTLVAISSRCAASRT